MFLFLKSIKGIISKAQLSILFVDFAVHYLNTWNIVGIMIHGFQS